MDLDFNFDTLKNARIQDDEFVLLRVYTFLFSCTWNRGLCYVRNFLVGFFSRRRRFSLLRKKAASRQGKATRRLSRYRFVENLLHHLSTARPLFILCVSLVQRTGKNLSRNSSYLTVLRYEKYRFFRLLAIFFPPLLSVPALSLPLNANRRLKERECFLKFVNREIRIELLNGKIILLACWVKIKFESYILFFFIYISKLDILFSCVFFIQIRFFLSS